MIWKVVETTDGWAVSNSFIPKRKKPYKSVPKYKTWVYDFYLDLESFFLKVKGE